MLSGTVTSLTVILIVIFLFKEGIGVFDKKPVEEGYVIAINKNNTIRKITSAEIKNIYDQKITHWNEVGGKPDSIVLFRLEDISNFYSDDEIGENFEGLPNCINRLVDSLPNIIAFFPEKYLKNSNTFYEKATQLESTTVETKLWQKGQNGISGKGEFFSF